MARNETNSHKNLKAERSDKGGMAGLVLVSLLLRNEQFTANDITFIKLVAIP